MSERQRIDDQLKRAYEGGAWVGPPIGEVLAGITPEQAAARPIPGAHTIWELVHHIGAWDEIVRRRLEGEPWLSYPDEQDWPPVPGGDGAAWPDALAALEERRHLLRETLAEFPESRLEEQLPGADYSYYVMLHGLIQHDFYHAGQIAILKRALARSAVA